MLIIVYYQLRRLMTQTDRFDNISPTWSLQSFNRTPLRCCVLLCCVVCWAHLRVEDGTEPQTCCFVTQQLQEQQKHNHNHVFTHGNKHSPQIWCNFTLLQASFSVLCCDKTVRVFVTKTTHGKFQEYIIFCLMSPQTWLENVPTSHLIISSSFILLERRLTQSLSSILLIWYIWNIEM